MRKYTKTGLLILTLAFPVLIFVFLKVFTSNRFDLPYFVPQQDAAGNVITKSDGDTAFYQIKDFALLSDGSAFSAATLKGKTIVVSTLSSPCSDTCQKVLTQLSRVQVLHQEYPSFTVLTLIEKGDHQIATSLEGRTQPGAGWLVFLLPDSTLSSAVQNVFRLNENVPGLQTISPRARLGLVDSAGFIRGFYDTTNPEEIDRLMAEVRILEHNRNEK